MSDCKVFRRMLVLHAEGVLASEDARHLEEHLAACPNCQAESEQVDQIRAWLSDPEIFGPEVDLAWDMLPQKLAERAEQLPSKTPRPLGLPIPRWVLGAVAIVVLACSLIWIVKIQAPVPPVNLTARAGAGNEAFLDRIRSVYLREATIQYLGGCHGLLLDLASAEKKCDRNHFDVSLEVARARQLLQEKRMLDAAPDVPDLARVRPLCDDLERFLIGLSTAGECETGDDLRLMERSIVSGQLLLRINVVSSGIS